MKRTNFIIPVFIIFFSSCDKTFEKDVPDCIQNEINEFKETRICNSGAGVSEYIFQNRYVYVFSHGTCGGDLGVDVLNEECNFLGMLGGFTRNTEINGEEFSKAEFQRIIWEE